MPLSPGPGSHVQSSAPETRPLDSLFPVTLLKVPLWLLWSCLGFESSGKKELGVADGVEMLANVYSVFIHGGQGKFFHFIFSFRGKKNAFPISSSSVSP